MCKAKILREVDKYLFASLVKQQVSVYAEAAKIQGGGFTYSFFGLGLLSTSQPHLSTIPKEATIQFLQPHLEAMSPLVKRRERIQAYLLQFLNQTSVIEDVFYLIPEACAMHLDAFTQDVPNPYQTNLVKLFKQKPEYEMIKQQEVFALMDVC